MSVRRTVLMGLLGIACGGAESALGVTPGAGGNAAAAGGAAQGAAGVGADCASDDDCAMNLRCAAVRCAPKTCSEIAPCAAAEPPSVVCGCEGRTQISNPTCSRPQEFTRVIQVSPYCDDQLEQCDRTAVVDVPCSAEADAMSITTRVQGQNLDVPDGTTLSYGSRGSVIYGTVPVVNEAFTLNLDANLLPETLCFFQNLDTDASCQAPESCYRFHRTLDADAMEVVMTIDGEDDGVECQ